MTTPQPGWYDDPEESNTQRYWDGQGWTPHRQPKSLPPTESLPPQPAPAVGYPPPPAGNYPPPPPSGPLQRSGNPTLVIAAIAAVAVLAVGGWSVYKFVLKHDSSSAPTNSATSTSTSLEADAPTQSAPGGPTHSAPGAPTGGGESKYLSDLSAVGITSSTARPDALVAKGKEACSDVAAGQPQDEAAANIVSSSNHFFDESTAENIVRVAIKDLCPQ